VSASLTPPPFSPIHPHPHPHITPNVISAVEEVWRWSPRLEKQQEQEKAHEWEHMRLEAEALKRRNADLESEVTALRASTILASTTGQDACIATIASVAEMAALMRGPGPGAGETAARTQHATNQNPLALRKELHENMKVERETNSALATHDTHVIESLEQSLAGSGSELEYWKDACRKLQDTHSGKQHAGALGEGYGMRLLSQASLSSVDDWTAEEENAAVDAETLATHTTAGGRTTRSPSPSKRQSSPGSTARSNSSSPYTLPQTKTYKASSKVYVDASKNRAISPSRRAQGARELAAAAVREIASLRRRLDRAMASRAKWKAHALESAQTASAAAAAAMVAVATPELFMTPTTPPRGASTDDPLSPSPLSSPTSVLAEEAEDQHARELELMTALEAIIDKCSALEARHGNK